MTTETVSYERDIRPLFRDRDRNSMRSRFDLFSYGDVRANADRTYGTLSGGTMPCDGAWPEENVARFKPGWTGTSGSRRPEFRAGLAAQSPAFVRGIGCAKATTWTGSASDGRSAGSERLSYRSTS